MQDAGKADDAGRGPEDAGARRLFGLTSASEALVLVRKIVADASSAYRELMSLRRRREELALQVGTDEQLATLRGQIEELIERLRRHERELAAIGCELKDFGRGVVDFPALLNGRKVLLCWQLGEPRIAYWHELCAGFAGRRPIEMAGGQVCPAASEGGTTPPA